jgi:hypothetical protein
MEILYRSVPRASSDGGPIPEWMDAKYELWYRDPRKIIHNLLANPEFVSGMDYAPHCDFQDGK